MKKTAVVFLGCILLTIGSANAAILTFDDLIYGETSYGFDGDGDGVDDVLFTTTDPEGFRTIGPGTNMTYINEPGLEGTSLLATDLRVDFLVGAVNSLSFGFALDSYTEDDTATISVYDYSDTLLATVTQNGFYTTTPYGTSSFPEGHISVSFSGVATYATFDFTSDWGRFIIDNLEGEFGTTERPECVDLDGDGYPTNPVECGASVGADCNDRNTTAYPGAPEICGDGIDNNCNDQIDDGCPTCTDADQDGFAAEGGACGPADCDDNNPAINPGAVEVCDDGIDNNCNGEVEEGCNEPPNCAAVYASPDCVWPPNNKMVPVNIMGVTDPNGDPVTITILSITSDEATATEKGAGGPKAAPDAAGVGTSQAMIRAERSGLGDGRVYFISFMADDGKGGTCYSSAVVRVPHDQSSKMCPAIDSGQKYDATKIN
jgi:hypothetical protein